MTDRGKAIAVLTANTAAFAVCFAVWTMYGVLVTFLVDQQVFAFTKTQVGWLIGIPVLTGSVFRLPAGMLADRYGGRPVFAAVMLLAAAAAYLTSLADGFRGFLLGGLGFGLAGASFAVGIAYTSVWFPQHEQGTALGIFGMGNAGAALTAMVAPSLLGLLTRGGRELEGWRMLPRTYAWALLAVTVLFWLFTFPRKPEHSAVRTLSQRLQPLRAVRVWRFGLYYFLTFGGFVALSQWLIPYYVNVYALSVVAAGLLSAFFTLPSGVLRALGGWLSDRLGARAVMYWTLGGCTAGFLLLAVPRMDIQSVGEGVMAERAGTVTAVTDAAITVQGTTYPLRAKTVFEPNREGAGPWPIKMTWQEPVVRRGDQVPKRGLLARGYTRIYFHANMVVFTGLVFLVGALMGMGSGAVYKHIPTYFPSDVGAVGGIVGVLGGLGGFAAPILFGYLLQWTGIWTTNWLFLFALALVCLFWMHAIVRRMVEVRAADVSTQIEERGTLIPVSLEVLCPVHGVSAHVRILTTRGGERLTLRECSLLPGEAGHLSCGSRCIVRAAESSR